MKFVKKIMRIIILLLAFIGVSSFAFAGRYHSGGTNWSGNYPYGDRGGGLSTEDYNPNDAFVVNDDDTFMQRRLKEDFASNKFSSEFADSVSEFLNYLHYVRYFGTSESIAGEDVNLDNWAMPYELRVTIQFYFQYVNYPEQGYYFETAANLIISDVTQTYEGVYNHPFGVNTVWKYENGKISYTIDSSNAQGIVVDDSLVRMQVISYSNSWQGYNSVVSPNPSGEFLVSIRDCEIENGNFVKINRSQYWYYAHLSSSDSWLKIYWSDYSQGGVTAPTVPHLFYPNSGDTYFNEEVNYYNYMSNQMEMLEDSYSFTMEDMEEFYDDDWGLLSLPSGIFLGMLDAMGEYSSVFSFHVNRISIWLPGNHYLTIPEMNTEIDLNDYPALLPFRYIISFFLLYRLSIMLWGIILSYVNNGKGVE